MGPFTHLERLGVVGRTVHMGGNARKVKDYRPGLSPAGL
jgi:hypothetical protein